MTDNKHFVVAVGASGSNGLQEMCSLLSELPETLSATLMCILHRAPERESNLARVLQRGSKFEVRIASDGENLLRGRCYIGLPDRHLTLESAQRACLIPHRQELRGKTVDLLFDSVAAHAGDAGIGVVLSGSLSDGSWGIQAIKGAGGAGLVCRPRDNAIMDMPAYAIARAAPPDFVGSVLGLAKEIIGRCRVS